MLNIGFIGHGGITGVHHGAYDRLVKEGAEISIDAYCDLREEKLENLGEARIYTDIEKFLEAEQGKLDIVDICLPTFLHSSTAVNAMKHGFNVLVEKPMALSVEQCQEMCDTAKSTGKTLMVAQCVRFSSFVRIAEEYIKNGTFGKVKTACFKRDGGTPRWSWNDWFLKEELSGGAILDLHVHDVDALQYLFGVPESLSSGAKKIIEGDGYDIISTNYYYKDGLFTHSTSDWTTGNNMYYGSLSRVDFEKGYLISANFAEHSVFSAVSHDGKVVDLSDRNSDFYYNEIKYYTECVAGGLPVTECLPEHSMNSIHIALTEGKSASLNGERIFL